MKKTSLATIRYDSTGAAVEIVDDTGKPVSTGSGGAAVGATAPLVKVGNNITLPAATTAAAGHMTAAQVTALAGKADTTTVNAALANKADTATVNSALATKKNAEAAPAAITGNVTLTSAHDGQTLYNATATARTITVAKDLPAGFGVAIAQNSTGAVTVVAAADVTILSNPAITKTGGAGTMLALTQTAPNTYTLAGQGVA